MNRRTIAAALLSLVLAAVAPSIAGAATTVDPVLGGQPVTVDLGPGRDVASGVAAQSDGKIVVVGTANLYPVDGSRSEMAVLRFTADGHLDPTFGDGGRVLFDGGRTGATAAAVALQPDGRIVVVGSANTESVTYPLSLVAVSRLDPAGRIDPTFNGGNLLLVQGGGPEASGRAVALQPDGRIVVTGTGRGTMVIRVMPDGSLDQSFGTAGEGRTDTTMSTPDSSFDYVGIRPDGRIVLAGTSTSTRHQIAAQYLANGTPDTTFGNGGSVYDPSDGQTNGAVLRPDGSLVTTGSVFRGSPGLQLNAVSATSYLADGSPDLRFGAGGRTLTDAPPFTYPSGSIGYGFGAFGNAVTVDGRGRLVVAGGAGAGSGDLAILRYNAFGALDTSLGRAGWLKTDVDGENDEFDAIGMLPNGGFAAAGSTLNGGVERIVLAVYKPTNQPAHPTAWGWNPLGELGDGTTLDHTSPGPVVGLSSASSAASVAAGTLHSLALDDHGQVYAWGWNGVGQLGDGTTVDSHQPVPVPGLTEVAAIAAGYNHSLAVQDGVVMAWGWNALGQLGDGTTVNRTTPVPVRGLTGVVAVSAGVLHSLALRGDGTVWAWGWNGVGQLGNGSTVDSLRPVQVAGLTDVIAISAGAYHNLALRSDGSVWTWGWNGFGQLGDPMTPVGVDRWTPVRAAWPGMVAIAAGGLHSLALQSDGTVWGWGYNGVGEVGDGTLTERGVMVPVTGLPPVNEIAASLIDSVATTADHQVWGWGWNAVGTLGDGTTVDRHSPVPTAGPLAATAIAAGVYHTLALGL
ncbi:MAG TPA: hypothetical protein VHT97_15035 [Acidimicrobiales bacterium]|nr:hypothetical protein [Acidimicrobiales bacterium]